MTAAGNSSQARRLLLLLVLALASALTVAGCGGSDGGNDGGPYGDEQATSGDEAAGGAAGDGPAGDEAGGEDGEAGPPAALAEDANYEGTKDVTGSDDVEMRLVDSAFEPTVLAGESGQELTVRLTNDGSLPHTFTIQEQDIDEVLQPGESAEVDVEMPESGTTEFICRFHEAQGMVGLLTAG